MILISFLALITCLIVGVFLPFLLNKQVPTLEDNENVTTAILQEKFTNELISELAQNTTSVSITTSIVAISISNSAISISAISSTNASIEVTNNDDIPTSEEESTNLIQSEDSKENINVTKSSINADEVEPVVKDEWINEKIAENREEISDSDLTVGAQIYDSLDTNYLFGLAGDGLTDSEKAEAFEYLQANLSASEYEIAKNLYMKYVHLLN